MDLYNVRIEVQTASMPRTVIDERVFEAENETEARKLGLLLVDSGQVYVSAGVLPTLYVTAEFANITKYRAYYTYVDTGGNTQEASMDVSVNPATADAVYRAVLRQFLFQPVVPEPSYSFFQVNSYTLLNGGDPEPTE